MRGAEVVFDVQLVRISRDSSEESEEGGEGKEGVDDEGELKSERRGEALVR